MAMEDLKRKLPDRLRQLQKMVKRLPRGRIIELGITAFLVIVVLSLPIYFGTRTYPVTIVEGTSMYPTLQNGDMVVYKGIDPMRVSNGTVIVYVQGNTGVTFLDTLTKPIIIHRVVGSFIQSDGSVYYVTKGDNNNFNDSSAVQANHVLGTPVQVIPKAGFLLLFFTSPQGLVALIGFITLFYLGNYEGKLNEDKTKETFLGAVANMVINDELPEDAFKRFELAVKYVNRDELEEIKGGLTQSLQDWLQRSAILKSWTVQSTLCPVCSQEATSYEGPDKIPFLVCPRCIWKRGMIFTEAEAPTVPVK